MSSSLKRVLRLRALQEDRARRELEAQTARLRELERSSSEAGRAGAESRERWFRAVEGGSGRGSGPGEREDSIPGERPSREQGGDPGPSLAVELEVWRGAVGRRARVDALRPAQEAEVERARLEFLGGRRERLQAEILIQAAAAAERAESERREQRQLDDWHRSRRKAKRTEGGESGTRSEF